MTQPSAAETTSTGITAGQRVVLAPGLRVVESGRGAWQVGLRHPGSRRLPRTPVVDRALQRLRAGDPLPDDPEVVDLLTGLAHDGLTLCLDDVPRRPRSPADSARVSGGLATHRAAVEVRGSLGADPSALLTALGLVVTTDPVAVLLLCPDEPDRNADLADLLRDRTPHLLVRVVDGVALIGPFVDPGRTACTHCIDLHADDDEPGAVPRLERYAWATRRPRDDGVPDPIDPALAQIATAWAVRDLATYAAGGRPSTWSATVVVPPNLADVTATVWRRHPHCGCGWG